MVNQTNKRMFSHETLYFCIVIALALGIILGYAWRMAQVDTEKAIVEALQGCRPLITEELMLLPTYDCEGLKTAILKLRTGKGN
ncbi:MAG: hypothetical protein DDT19_02952 [Syntrophomonadaceae bacterium]|nr:hypothetical protein [Bacillota bacterium]